MPVLDGGDAWGLPTGYSDILDGGSANGLPVGNRDTVDGGSSAGLPYRNDTETVLYLAARELQDATNRRWDKLDVLLPYLNLGILEIINLQPDAYVVTEDITLIAGAVQSYPTGMIQMIDFVCNLNGSTIGSEIRTVLKEFMDHLVPGWMVATADATVVFAVVDPRDKQKFYVYPPQPTSTTRKIRSKITKQPDEILTVQHELKDLPIDASLQPALVNYIPFRVLSEETTISNSQEKSKDFYNKFLQALGLKGQVEEQTRAKGN